MALAETDLQDILSQLSIDEQQQLLSRLKQKLEPSSEQPKSIETKHKQTESGKVYCCPLCGSASYKGKGYSA